MSNIPFSDWQAQQNQDPDFLAECRRLELGYQIARLRLLRGMTQAELADKVGTLQPSIARLENWSRLPSLCFLLRIAKALNAQVEIRIAPIHNPLDLLKLPVHQVGVIGITKYLEKLSNLDYTNSNYSIGGACVSLPFCRTWT